jgi:hypothetical protein
MLRKILMATMYGMISKLRYAPVQTLHYVSMLTLVIAVCCVNSNISYLMETWVMPACCSVETLLNRTLFANACSTVKVRIIINNKCSV